jgi:hypothetical protein
LKSHLFEWLNQGGIIMFRMKKLLSLTLALVLTAGFTTFPTAAQAAGCNDCGWLCCTVCEGDAVCISVISTSPVVRGPCLERLVSGAPVGADLTCRVQSVKVTEGETAGRINIAVTLTGKVADANRVVSFRFHSGNNWNIQGEARAVTIPVGKNTGSAVFEWDNGGPYRIAAALHSFNFTTLRVVEAESNTFFMEDGVFRAVCPEDGTCEEICGEGCDAAPPPPFVLTPGIHRGTVGVGDGAENTPHINLTAESIELLGVTVQAFSLDGGTRWRRGALPQAARFQRLFNRGMTLHVTSAFDSKAKEPGEGAVTIQFPEIAARPRRNPDRLAPFYGSTHWGLAPRGSTEWAATVIENIQYAPSSNGKTPNEDTWMPLTSEGIEIALSGRNAFVFRISPTGNTPGSPAWRVRAAAFGKAPNYRLRDIREGDAKVRGIAFRRGDQWAFSAEANATVTSLTFGAPLADRAVHTVAALRTESKIAATADTNIYIRGASTGRRPPTLTQMLPLAAPAVEGGGATT